MWLRSSLHGKACLHALPAGTDMCCFSSYDERVRLIVSVLCGTMYMLGGVSSRQYGIENRNDVPNVSGTDLSSEM